jgi:GNAT superfamily N-acetyltransferase
MDVEITVADKSDAQQILELQKIAFHKEAALNGDMQIAPMVEALDDTESAFTTHVFLIARKGSDIIGSVRARAEDDTCHIGRLFVAPEHQGRGIGRQLFIAAEQKFPSAGSYRLITGKLSSGNIRLYESLGYQVTGEMMENGRTPLVVMEKKRV